MKLREVIQTGETMTTVNIKHVVTPDMKQINKAFKNAGFEIRIVGGAVRDVILGQIPKDIDFATNATPEEMKFLFDENYIKWIPTGEKHGTLTALGPKSREPFEITTLRIDTNQDGRHAEVEFTRSWEKDAERRDLTYNALSMDLDGTIYDYYGGIEDLQNGITRFVGDPNERIQEDFLRILRMFRFSARYGHKLTPRELMAVSRNANGLSNISGERIWMEIQKILVGNNSEQALEDMKKTGVTNIVGLRFQNTREMTITKKFTKDPVTLIMSLTNTKDQLDHFINSWHWSNSEKDLAQFLFDHKFERLDTDKAKFMLVDGVPFKFIEELCALTTNPSVLKDIQNWNIPVFPVTGKDLIAAGMKPGPDMGRKLSSLRHLWIISDFSMTKDELLSQL